LLDTTQPTLVSQGWGLWNSGNTTSWKLKCSAECLYHWCHLDRLKGLYLYIYIYIKYTINKDSTDILETCNVVHSPLRMMRGFDEMGSLLSI
jgi:hypothetical protein